MLFFTFKSTFRSTAVAAAADVATAATTFGDSLKHTHTHIHQSLLELLPSALLLPFWVEGGWGSISILTHIEFILFSDF